MVTNQMTKLIKFLKPFTILILLAIGFLFLQATTDLALPDYMSDIVNVGIQQEGFESAIFEKIARSDYDSLKALLDETDRAFWESSYVLNEADGFFELGKLNDDDLQKLEKVTIQMVSKMTNMHLDETLMKSFAIDSIKTYSKEIGIDTESIQRNYILKTGGKMLLIALIGAAASVAVGFLAARTASGLGRNLRSAVFKKVSSFSNHEMDHFTTASLITRSTNDITQIQNLTVMMIRMLFYAPILGVGGVIRAVEKSTSMSWIIAVAVLVLMGIIAVLFVVAMPKFKAIQKMVDGLNRIVRENLTGMMVVRAFNTQDFEKDRFDQANKQLTQTNLFVNRMMVFLMPAMMLILNGVSLTIVWIGAKQIDASAMQVGDMMAFMQYAMQIIMSFLMLSMMFIMIPRASVSAVRVAEVLETPVEIKSKDNPEKLPQASKGQVVFDQVSFKYKGAEEEILKGISFVARPGEMTAIIGSTGSGKSTLVNLIPRFYEATRGNISIDGVPIHELSLEELRKNIGYVPQKAILFSGDIESNLKFGSSQASEEVLTKALRISQAENIVEEKPEKLHASVSQGGANLSGGQKQRLSIARALVKEPKIFIFDDSFSALDYRTDAELRRALKAEVSEATVIVVAQRVSTIKEADQILVLDEGELVGIGNHEALMASCQTYREIAFSQLSAEELR